jgi:nicotinate-nucleotide adenylyltransferase
MTGSGATGERIGVFGGTFDPPHCGHVAVARDCVRVLDLDRLLVVVANDPYMKEGDPRTPAEDRFAMVARAMAGLDRVTPSRMEIDRGGPSYTVDTAEALHAAARARGAPAPQVFVVVGADLVSQLASWHRADDLRRLVTLVVVGRPGSPAPDLPPGWIATRVGIEEMAVSSSEVRALLVADSPVAALVPDAVIRYIGERSLYAVDR